MSRKKIKEHKKRIRGENDFLVLKTLIYLNNFLFAGKKIRNEISKQREKQGQRQGEKKGSSEEKGEMQGSTLQIDYNFVILYKKLKSKNNIVGRLSPSNRQCLYSQLLTFTLKHLHLLPACVSDSGGLFFLLDPPFSMFYTLSKISKEIL